MPGPPYSSDKVAARIVMVRCGETPNSGQGLLLGTRDEELTILGDVQGQKAAELLMDLKVGLILVWPCRMGGGCVGNDSEGLDVGMGVGLTGAGTAAGLAQGLESSTPCGHALRCIACLDLPGDVPSRDGAHLAQSLACLTLSASCSKACALAGIESSTCSS